MDFYHFYIYIYFAIYNTPDTPSVFVIPRCSIKQDSTSSLSMLKI